MRRNIPVLSAEQQQDVVTRYLAGETQRAIAEAYGLSTTPIHRTLVRHGIRSWRWAKPPNERGWPFRRDPTPAEIAERAAEVRARWDAKTQARRTTTTATL